MNVLQLSFVKLYGTVEVQLNTEVYSYFGSIIINPVITGFYLKLVWVE